MKKGLFVACIILLFLAGLALLFYSDISNWLAELNQSAAIQEYNSVLVEITAEQIEKERQKANEYNNALSEIHDKNPFIPDDGIVLPENYTSTLNLNGTIGFIEIPVIGVSLPIFHGTGETALRKGAGHMEMTAFPIGGEGNHSVLTSHTALPSAKLFTDLDKLKVNDMFYIHVLDETLAYTVDQILVVKPENTEELRPVKEKDYVTLITCTPYAVNSHRLLVRGTRVPYTADEAEQIVKTINKPINWRMITVVVVIVVSIVIYILYKYSNRQKKRGR